jgi:hypothetical protein
MSDFQAILYNPIQYDSGVQAGFIVFPHSTEQPAGWGQPYVTETGEDIDPGTPGGPNPNRVVGITKGEWKRRKSSYHQAVGNIDWRGPWRDTKKQERRFVITVNGPPSRHWNPGSFVYEGVSRNHEIYTDGKVLSCAPYPVLGAAFCVHTDPLTEQTVRTLVAICKNGMVDELYTRPYPSPIKYENLTDDVRAQMEELADSQSNPNGWVFRAASYQLDNGFAPDTPWFFNEDGTQARTMRRRTMVYTDANGEDREEQTFVELVMQYTPVSHTGLFYDLDDQLNNRMTTFQEMWRQSDHTWIDPEDQFHDGVYHKWKENSASGTVFTIGNHKVAVDWSIDDGAWVYGWFDVYNARSVQQFWTDGDDPGGTSHPNNSRHDGNQYPATGVPFFGDHTAGVYLGCNDHVNLLIGTNLQNPALKFYLGWGLIGTKSMMLGGGPTEEDPYFYFWDSIDVFLHHVDLRSKMIVGYVRYDSILYDYTLTANLSYYYEKMEVGGKNFDTPVLKGDIYNRFTSEVVDLGYIFDNIGWTYAEMQDWEKVDVGTEEDPQRIEAYTYQDVQITKNDDESIWEPSFKTFYKGAFWTSLENAYLWRRQINDYVMRVDYCYREGVFASNEKDHSILSFVYPDNNGGEEQTQTQMWPEGDLGALVGGNQFHPGGPI